MTPQEFIAKWRKVELSERSASQQHFLDLCDLVTHPKPAAMDATGESFTFERGATKHSGGDGWADVWKKGFFGWEYKGKHKDLEAAYKQLLTYRESLENPPLLVVSDMDRIIIRTNFTGTPTQKFEIDLANLDQPEHLNTLRAVFHDPAALRPDATIERITAEAARQIGEIAQAMRGRGLDAHRVAHFLDRIIFCLFAEDIELLPKTIFTKLLEKTRNEPKRFAQYLSDLFQAMADGGDFLLETILHFDGNLFNDSAVLELTQEEINLIYKAALLDWGAVDPSIFGTLFERGLDPNKRAQLGAHYTSREDIETLIEPVIMTPLRREWQKVQAEVDELLAVIYSEAGHRSQKNAYKKAQQRIREFHDHLSSVKILDPACGSGNFLYVALQKLLDMEKEVGQFTRSRDMTAPTPAVGPWQLFGIEINPYAADLAQMTVWIGYLQWRRDNGYLLMDDPVLKPLDNIQCRDAILNLSDPENPTEPDWPAVDFIVSNPPFLGGKFLRRELGDDYVDSMFRLWRDRVPAEADLCCYWFEKARQLIENDKCGRAGLLATQGIRGGANREILYRIKQSGEIFYAESDRPWILEGASVHVSMVGFDDKSEKCFTLDGDLVSEINTNLTSSIDITIARKLGSNKQIGFMGTTKQGPFDIPEEIALEMLVEPNPNLRPNSDILIPWINGRDITTRIRNMWIIDFFPKSAEESSRYELPWHYVDRNIRVVREQNPRSWYRGEWWWFYAPRPELRASLEDIDRFIVTPTVSKHRLFQWIEKPINPDHQLIVFSSDEDFFFGILHSRIHEVWARAQGTQLRERESGFRYTPTTCFETFPFPDASDELKTVISSAAKVLVELRSNWLNPPEWTKEEILEFPGAVDGPWKRYVQDPDERGIGTARYAKKIPRDIESARKLKKRTLTNLYNLRPEWLSLAHNKLDEAVAEAYGISLNSSDDDILHMLLDRNLNI